MDCAARSTISMAAASGEATHARAGRWGPFGPRSHYGTRAWRMGLTMCVMMALNAAQTGHLDQMRSLVKPAFADTG